MILIGNQMVYSWNSGIISLAFCPNANNFFRLQAREIIRIWLHIQIAYRAGPLIIGTFRETGPWSLTFDGTITKIRVASTAFICKWTWNRIYYVNIHLCHQYGVSVAESQTFLLAKRPSAAMSEKKRLPFAGRYRNRHKSISFTSSCCPWKMQVESYLGELFKTYLHYTMLIFIIIILFYYFKLITYYIDA